MSLGPLFDGVLDLGEWRESGSSDPAALRVVDGLGPFSRHGPHYSRRTPGSVTFTGVGREVVLVHESGRAVWSVLLQKTPSRVGSGGSRGRDGAADAAAVWVWRNNVFRNLGAGLSSSLITSATAATYALWAQRYGRLPNPAELYDGGLRTEVDTGKVRSRNPGYCYQCAGWRKGPVRRGILHMYAPTPTQ